MVRNPSFFVGERESEREERGESYYHLRRGERERGEREGEEKERLGFSLIYIHIYVYGLGSLLSSASSIRIYQLFKVETLVPCCASNPRCRHCGTKDESSSMGSSSNDWRERAVSAAAAAVLSAIIVNPLDVVKTRLQAQAAGMPYYAEAYKNLRQNGPSWSASTVELYVDGKCPPVCPRGGSTGAIPLCPPACFHYNGTLDVFSKIIRQEGFSRLWRGTNAALALAVPTVGIYLPLYDILRDSLESFAEQEMPQLLPYAPMIAGSMARSMACISCSPIELARTRMQAKRELGVKPPGIFRTLLEVTSVNSGAGGPFQGVRALWVGVGAQLARDVPFSAICWATLEPTRRYLKHSLGSEETATTILAANFSSGVIAGGIAAAATCPLDVAKTRRQIEKDPLRLMKMTTRNTLVEIWREGGIRDLFTGVLPRVGRAGPSVGIVISFYELVKHILHKDA